MTVISSSKDLEALTVTFVAEFEADAERIWQVWEDPRQLERWWGPPTWPATFEHHDFRVGGASRYFMAGPDGEREHGWWTITAIDAPHRFEFTDGFAGDDGEPNGVLGETHAVVTLDESQGRTRMTVVTHFESVDQLEKMVEMGMQEGTTQAMGQIDDLIAERVQSS